MHQGSLLIDGNRIAILAAAHVTAGQPDIDTVVVVAEASRVMQSTDRSNDLAVLLEWLERPGELVVPSRRRDLVVERVDAVRKVDKRAAARCRRLLRRIQRDHAFQHRQGDARAHRT